MSRGTNNVPLGRDFGLVNGTKNDALDEKSSVGTQKKFVSLMYPERTYENSSTANVAPDEESSVGTSHTKNQKVTNGECRTRRTVVRWDITYKKSKYSNSGMSRERKYRPLGRRVCRGSFFRCMAKNPAGTIYLSVGSVESWVQHTCFVAIRFGRVYGQSTRFAPIHMYNGILVDKRTRDTLG